jgi:hypothetical protein
MGREEKEDEKGERKGVYRKPYLPQGKKASSGHKAILHAWLVQAIPFSL